jgi:hypothetical protein
MVHNTAKLGGPASDVVVAKVGVSCTTLSNAIFNICCPSIAWAYDDDLEANAYHR